MPRPKALVGIDRDKAIKMHDAGNSLRAIASEMGVSAPTVMREVNTASMYWIEHVELLSADKAYSAAFCGARQGAIACDDRMHLERIARVLSINEEVHRTRSGGRWMIPRTITHDWCCHGWEEHRVRGLVDRAGSLSIQVTSTVPTPTLTIRMRVHAGRHSPLWTWLAKYDITPWKQRLSSIPKSWDMRIRGKQAEKFCRLIYEGDGIALPANLTVWRYAKAILGDGFELKV